MLIKDAFRLTAAQFILPNVCNACLFDDITDHENRELCKLNGEDHMNLINDIIIMINYGNSLKTKKNIVNLINT